MTDNIQIPSNISGYTATDDYAAQCTVQGGRTHYAVALPLNRVPDVLPVPDPAKPFDDNRVVNPAHAEAFADYVFKNPNWHCGPLTVRTTSDTVVFEMFPGADYGVVKLGLLKVPRSRRSAFAVVDGQHRILGVQKLLERVGVEVLEKTSRLQKAKNAGEDKMLIAELERQLVAIREIEDRVLNRDSILIDLIIENDRERARQIFVDVADNALGINKSVKNRFDMRKVVNRALNEVLISPVDLLRNRVDDQKNAIAGNNKNLIGAGTLSDIIRILCVGIVGRISAQQETTLVARNLADTANQFFEDLTIAFPQLNDVANGTTSTTTLRETSLLGSSTMLRVLAGVYHEVADARGRGRSGALAFLHKLAPHMSAPVTAGTISGDIWLNAGTEGAFTDGGMAPGARAQQVKELVNVMASWVDNPPAGL